MQLPKQIPVGPFFIGPNQPLTLFCGPCVIESRDHLLRCAEALVAIFSQFPNIQFVFKSSYDKANRQSLHSFRGVGLHEGLDLLKEVKERFGVPVLTDVHAPEEARAAGHVCDVVQIPAMLCRQTDLVVAAAATQKTVNIKKGQFLAPLQMRSIADKVLDSGNQQLFFTERGTTFGYNNLVVDMRAIPLMQELGFPVCFDATHAVQLPGGMGDRSGGESQFIPTLAFAAIAAGANALYIEAHPCPKEAKSDAATVLDFTRLPALLRKAEQLYQVTQSL